MEPLSVHLPKPAGFHKYVASSFIVLTDPELVFIEEPEITARAFCCTQCTEELAESMTSMIRAPAEGVQQVQKVLAII